MMMLEINYIWVFELLQPLELEQVLKQVRVLALQLACGASFSFHRTLIPHKAFLAQSFPPLHHYSPPQPTSSPHAFSNHSQSLQSPYPYPSSLCQL